MGFPFDDEPASGASPSTERLASEVLVVDDEAVVRDLMTRLLTRDADLLVTTAADAEEALAQLKDRRFDVLITDKNLPELGGVELIAEARKLQPNLESMLMTGYPSAESIIGAFAAGASDYLVKPFDKIQIVRAKVRAALNRRAERVKIREGSRLLGRQAHELLAQGRDAPEALWQKLDEKLHGYERIIQEQSGKGRVLVIGSERLIDRLAQAGIRADAAEPSDPTLQEADVVVVETTVKQWRTLVERLQGTSVDVMLVAGPNAELGDLLEAIALRLELIGFESDSPGVALVDGVRSQLLRRSAEKAQAELAEALGEFREALGSTQG